LHLVLRLMKPSTNPYRLVRSVVPSAYRIFLTPDLEAFTFAGRVEIDVDVAEEVSEITMHALDLELGAATISVDGTSYRSQEHRFDETYQTVTFVFDRSVPTGPAVIEIAFDGTLNDLLCGFYRSSFVDDEGVKHTIATTQFENSDARRCFPCWDEPAFKATYQVNLTIPSHLAAYSNSPLVSDTDLGNGQRALAFSPTMKMSTYLVAFVVGPFGETEAVDVDGVPLRVIYPRGKGHLTDLAKDAGVFALRFFSDYFNIPYPGDKLDMLAIPDFTQGAMENLGCITFRESDLLIDPATASLAEKERVTHVVDHEMAHMWFGDLVTMEWWEGIWLNEAFATFMQVLCTDAYRPEWKTLVGFGTDRDLALQIDGLHSTRPIEYEVVSPDDMRMMFDLLTYEKGGSVLRMLEQYLGAETFRDGIRHYLTKHAYANTVTSDLWDALEEISKEPVREIMNTWILQGGHPLLTLENGQLSQQPFAYGAATATSAIGSSWAVPVFTRSLKGGVPSRHLLREEPLTITDEAPVVVNAGGSGVFRSRYAKAELAALSEHIDELEELERATLVADGWASLFAGQSDWADFYAIASGLGDKDEPAAWIPVASAIDLGYRALDDDQRVTFRKQVRALLDPQFARLGWDKKPGENELAPQVRSIVIGILGTVCSDEAIRAEAVRRFEANDLDGDLAGNILRIVASQDRPGDYETYLERYRTAPTPQDAQRILRFGLGAFRDERVALDAAEKCFSEFRTADASTELGILSRNEVTGPAVWRYFTSRWDEAVAKFPTDTMDRSTLGVSTFVKDATFAAEVDAFHTAHPIVGRQRTVEQALERMRYGVVFADALRRQF
jgi:puromycin-sensitive aminopeptidase